MKYIPQREHITNPLTSVHNYSVWFTLFLPDMELNRFLSTNMQSYPSNEKEHAYDSFETLIMFTYNGDTCV